MDRPAGSRPARAQPFPQRRAKGPRTRPARRSSQSIRQDHWAIETFRTKIMSKVMNKTRIETKSKIPSHSSFLVSTTTLVAPSFGLGMRGGETLLGVDGEP